MIFLIEYDRASGKIAELRKFDDASLKVAEDARLELELKLNRAGVQHEVVLLDAPSEEALRRTHSRYFEDFAQIARTKMGAGADGQ
ncbi:MAG TPA: hypothetical protein VMV34_05570 [Terriglobia bacterium]|nr:hypothetical protein [Terriglobia bacterium]